MAIPRPLKWILWVVGTLAVLAASMMALLAWFFSGLVGEPSKDEVARVVSPTGKVDAVLFETNGGATTSFGYEVYVVEHGAQPSGSPPVSLYGAIRNQQAYGANLKWISPDSVAVEILSAKSTKIEATYDLFCLINSRNPTFAARCANVATPALVKAYDFKLARSFIPDTEPSARVRRRSRASLANCQS